MTLRKDTKNARHLNPHRPPDPGRGDPVTARHADALFDLLSDLALVPGSAEVGPEVVVLAWAEHAPEALAAAWQAFRDAVRDREAMATGERDWTSVDPGAADLEDALRRAAARIGDAYQALAWGPDGAGR